MADGMVTKHICVIVFVKQLRLGLRFPLDPFIMEVLSLFQSSIAQIHHNSWRILISFMFLCWFHYLTPYARVFASMYPLSYKGAEDFYYFIPKKGSGLFYSFPQSNKN